VGAGGVSQTTSSHGLALMHAPATQMPSSRLQSSTRRANVQTPPTQLAGDQVIARGPSQVAGGLTHVSGLHGSSLTHAPSAQTPPTSSQTSNDSVHPHVPLDASHSPGRPNARTIRSVSQMGSGGVVHPPGHVDATHAPSMHTWPEAAQSTTCSAYVQSPPAHSPGTA
jgi:hypothetical protein